MATQEERLRATDDAVQKQRLGSALIVVGWVLIAMDCILAVWIWVGLRSGSDLWLWWVIIEGILGLAFIFVGRRKRQSGQQVLSEDSSQF